MSYNILKKMFHFSKKTDVKTNHLDVETDHPDLDAKVDYSSENGLKLYVGTNDDKNYIQTYLHTGFLWEISMFITDELNEDQHLIADELFYSMVEEAKSYGIKGLIVQPKPCADARTKPLKEGADFGKMIYGKRGFKYATDELCKENDYIQKGMMYLSL